MDLNYTPEDIAFRKQVRAWLEQNLPADPLRGLAERKVWHRKLYEAGYLGMGWPKEYGGQGADVMRQTIVNEEMVRARGPQIIGMMGIQMVGATLITHGTNDYRVPDANGLAYYNTLLVRGVPTRLVWFPDENHWVLKPRNSRLWYREFFDWLKRHDRS